MSRRTHGIALVEALGATLLLAILGLMAASLATTQIELVERERAFVRAHALVRDLDWQLRRTFAQADAGVSTIAWHFEGIHATLALPATGLASHPAPVPFLTPAAPRWTVFPAGQPRRRSAPSGYVQEGGGAWLVVAPVAGAAEPDPTAPGWDANENGIVDRPDLPATPADEAAPRGLVYTIAIEAPTVAGGSYAVHVRVYRAMAFRAAVDAGASVLEVAGTELLTLRTLELRPGGAP